MVLGKQAKVLTPAQLRVLTLHLAQSAHPARNRVLVELSFHQGLRAVEMGGLRWGMLLDAEGQLGDAIALPSIASKGRSSGRVLPLHPDARHALQTLLDRVGGMPPATSPVLVFAKGSTDKTTRSATIQYLFRSWFRQLSFEGCSSHSGRRFFITHCAKNVSKVGGTLRDVQMLAGHASLSMTQRYIDLDPDASRKLVALL